MLATIIGTQLWQCPFPKITAQLASSEHLTRDQRPVHTESLQIPSSMLVLLLFSSSHSFSIGLG